MIRIKLNTNKSSEKKEKKKYKIAGSRNVKKRTHSRIFLENSK